MRDEVLVPLVRVDSEVLVVLVCSLYVLARSARSLRPCVSLELSFLSAPCGNTYYEHTSSTNSSAQTLRTVRTLLDATSLSISQPPIVTRAETDRDNRDVPSAAELDGTKSEGADFARDGRGAPRSDRGRGTDTSDDDRASCGRQKAKARA
jgi:hypothetical protein